MIVSNSLICLFQHMIVSNSLICLFKNMIVSDSYIYSSCDILQQYRAVSATWRVTCTVYTYHDKLINLSISSTWLFSTLVYSPFISLYRYSTVLYGHFVSLYTTWFMTKCSICSTKYITTNKKQPVTLGLEQNITSHDHRTAQSYDQTGKPQDMTIHWVLNTIFSRPWTLLSFFKPPDLESTWFETRESTLKTFVFMSTQAFYLAGKYSSLQGYFRSVEVFFITISKLCTYRW